MTVGRLACWAWAWWWRGGRKLHPVNFVNPYRSLNTGTGKSSCGSSWCSGQCGWLGGQLYTARYWRSRSGSLRWRCDCGREIQSKSTNNSNAVREKKIDGSFVVYVDSDDGTWKGSISRNVFSGMKKIIAPTIVMLLEKRNLILADPNVLLIW